MIDHILRREKDNDINIALKWAPGEGGTKTKDHVEANRRGRKKMSRFEVIGRSKNGGSKQG